MNMTPFESTVIREARSWIGTPYIHQASLKQVGCDCLGLVRGIWQSTMGPEPEQLPAYTYDWGEVSGGEFVLEAMRRNFEEVEVDEMRPANVLVFRWQPSLTAKHLGILTTPKKFVHAYEKSGVIENSLGSHWARRIAGVFAFPSG